MLSPKWKVVRVPADLNEIVVITLVFFSSLTYTTSNHILVIYEKEWESWDSWFFFSQKESDYICYGQYT